VKLPADKREANTEFEQKFQVVVEQTLFEVALMRVAADREEIEIVGVLAKRWGCETRQQTIRNSIDGSRR
jgi:hypothetical protein